jgi:hypothetical protein
MRMDMVRSRLGLQLGAIFGTALTLLLAGGLIWLDHSERQRMAQQVEQSTEQSALTLEASLKSIMLAGKGPIAHDWLKRVKQTTHFDDVRIFRRDGTEALIDNTTIASMHGWVKNVSSTMIARSSRKPFLRLSANRSPPPPPEPRPESARATT